MQYLNLSDETWRASTPYSDIYLVLSFTSIKLLLGPLNENTV